MRARDLYKAPGVAETLHWADAPVTLVRIALEPATVADTIGVMLEYPDDLRAFTPEVAAKPVAERPAS